MQRMVIFFLTFLLAGCSSGVSENQVNKFEIQNVKIGMNIDKLSGMRCYSNSESNNDMYLDIEQVILCKEGKVSTPQNWGLEVWATNYQHKIYMISYTFEVNDTLDKDSKLGMAIIKKYGKPLDTASWEQFGVNWSQWNWFKEKDSFYFSVKWTSSNKLNGKPSCTIFALNTRAIKEDKEEMADNYEKENARRLEQLKKNASPPPKL